MDTQITYTPEMHPTKEDLLKILGAGEAVVTFTKANGDTRVMRCTLAPGLLPEGWQLGGVKYVNEDDLYPELIHTFDLDKNAWRSFRTSTVQSVCW